MNRMRDLMICALLLAIPLVFLRSNLRDTPPVGPFDRAILLISAPMQKLATQTAEKVHSFWSDYVFLVRLRGENKRLRRENAKLRAQIGQAKAAADRVQDLERLLELRGETPAETLVARVIARDTSPSFRIVRIAIERGNKEVATGMPVIASEGVVGRIQRAYGDYSDVLLAVDPQSAMDVKILPSGARGIARGRGGDRQGLSVDYVIQEDKVSVGDRVVTSEQASAFPRDMEVGVVTRISSTPGSLYHQIEVRPAVDFSRLEQVLVLLAAPPTPDLAARVNRREPARGLGVHR